MAKRKTEGAVEFQPRQGRARRMGEMLPQVGGVAFKRFGFVQSSVVSRWPEIVGERYAPVSAPESIRFPHGKREKGVLSLVVVPAHAPMMQHVAPVIVERVNRFFGYQAIERVTIRQGEVARVREQRPKRADVPVPVELGESLRTVGDPELKTVLEALAQGIARQSAVIPVMGKVQ
jgi:hypothetical protein